MLRKQARQRREYLYNKALTERLKSKQKIQETVVQSINENKSISSKNVKKSMTAYKSLKYADDGVDDRTVNDEYHYAGCEDPKIMLTTSHNPSSRLKMFMKELRLIIPNAQQMNRGNYQLTTLMHACRANNVTDFLIVHEHRGIPDSLVVCHLPYGPTAFFNISDVVMRHDIPDIGHMSEQKPHLIFNNFKTPIGLRTVKILKHLFPVPKENSTRVMSFLNHNDSIIFRHHQYKFVNKELELSEVGPRFALKLYQIKLGTLENIKAADTEWINRPYMNTSQKRLIFSNDPGIINKDTDV